MTAERGNDLWVVHNDPSVAEWYGGAFTREQAAERARDWGDAWSNGGFHKWLAYDRADGELVGRGGASRLPDDSSDRAAIASLVPDWEGVEIGWALRSPFWGRGYATEIGRAGLGLAFSLTGVVVAFTETNNERSRAVMERLGMTRVGEFTGDVRFVVYAITSAEWTAHGNHP